LSFPPSRTRYLSEISENNRAYDKWVTEQSETAQQLYSLDKVATLFKKDASSPAEPKIQEEISKLKLNLDPKNQKLIEDWPKKAKSL